MFTHSQAGEPLHIRCWKKRVEQADNFIQWVKSNPAKPLQASPCLDCGKKFFLVVPEVGAVEPTSPIYCKDHNYGGV